MTNRKIIVYDSDVAQGERLAVLMKPLAAEVAAASSLARASRQALEDRDVAVFLAVVGPLDGPAVRLFSGLKKVRPHLAIIAGAKLTKPETAAEILAAGLVDGIAAPEDEAGLYTTVRSELQKQDLTERADQLARSLRRHKLEQGRTSRHTRELEEIYDATLENLMTALDIRDVETFGHSQTVAKYAQALAKLLGADDDDRLGRIRKGALLHDIGKIAIPDSILKKPGPLSPEEWKKIKLHPALGYGLIKEIKLVPEVGHIILYHHERYDGGGYPQGLTADEIPPEARIFAVADALDAITAHRPYRRPRDMKFARKEIIRNTGTHFDPKTVEAFCSLDLDQWEKIRYETTSHIPSIEDFSRLLKKVKD
jgi:putative nucleotidyltransferase with HDIG domain